MSSDSLSPDELWKRHYQAATQRRRARGLHRRDAGHDSEQGRRTRRLKIYVAAGALFVAATLIAMFIPR
jgi:hypothetical protein